MKRMLSLGELLRSQRPFGFDEGFAGGPHKAMAMRMQILEVGSKRCRFLSKECFSIFGSIDAHKQQQSEEGEQAP